MLSFKLAAFLLALPVVGVVAAVVSSVPLHPLYFEPLVFKSLLLYAAFLVAVGLAPRLARSLPRPAALASGAVLSLLPLFTSLLLWLSAVEVHAWSRLPLATTQGELKALWEKPWGQRSLGVLVQGEVQGQPSPVTHYDISRGGGSWFPTYLTLRLQDGHNVQVGGLGGVRQAIHWPALPQRAYSRGLQHGDPVVAWGDPAAFKALGTGAPSYGVGATRGLAYGSLEQFRSGFLQPASRASKIFGWLGLGALPFSLLPFVLVLRQGSISGASRPE